MDGGLELGVVAPVSGCGAEGTSGWSEVQHSTEWSPAIRWVGSDVSVDVVCCFSESGGGRQLGLPGGDPAGRVRPRGRGWSRLPLAQWDEGYGGTWPARRLRPIRRTRWRFVQRTARSGRRRLEQAVDEAD